MANVERKMILQLGGISAEEKFLQGMKMLVFAAKVWYTSFCVNNRPSVREAFPAG